MCTFPVIQFAMRYCNKLHTLGIIVHAYTSIVIMFVIAHVCVRVCVCVCVCVCAVSRTFQHLEYFAIH